MEKNEKIIQVRAGLDEDTFKKLKYILINFEGTQKELLTNILTNEINGRYENCDREV